MSFAYRLCALFALSVLSITVALFVRPGLALFFRRAFVNIFIAVAVTGGGVVLAICAVVLSAMLTALVPEQAPPGGTG
jgi:multisubunit Na+/H+ antiporter MnhC subunit